MLKPGFDEGAILESFRQIYRGARHRHVVVPSVFEPESAAAARLRVTDDGLSDFHIADRGRYASNTRFVDDMLFDSLRGFAEKVVEAPLELAAHRWLRFRRGDYQLIRGDSVERGLGGPHLELTVDLSAHETDQADTVYTDGTESFVVPQWPLAVALVARDDSLYRYERYLNHQVGEAEVWRLRLSLRFKR